MVTDRVMCELLDVVADRLYCQSVRFCCLLLCSFIVGKKKSVKFRTGLVTTLLSSITALISCFSMFQLILQYNNMKMTLLKKKARSKKTNQKTFQLCPWHVWRWNHVHPVIIKVLLFKMFMVLCWYSLIHVIICGFLMPTSAKNW